MGKGRLVFAAVAIAAMAASGSAFTASNTFASGSTVPTTGYGTTSVSGATINTLTYNLNGPGANVDTVTLVLAGDTTTSAVFIGFNGGTKTSCGTGVFATNTTYTCDNGGAHFVQTTAGLTDTAVIVN